MKRIGKKHGVTLLTVLGLLIIISAVILKLSTSIQDKMEVSATSNIQGTVQIIADSVTTVQNNNINGIHQMAATLHMADDLESVLLEGKKNGLFSWAAVADAATGEGICYDGTPFCAADLGVEDTALSGEKSVSNAHVNSQGTWAITVQSPVFEGGVQTGALYADISLEHYSEILPMSIYNQDGALYMLDKRTYRFMLQPSHTRLHISTKYDLNGFLGDLGDVDEELEQDIYHAIEKGLKQIVQIRFDGAPTYLFFWPVEQSDWYLCGIVPEASIQQESTAVGHTISLVAIISFAAAGMLLYMVYRNYRRATLQERKEEQYRIALFKGISISIDEVVLMYDCMTGKREMAFDNMKRVLGVDADGFEAVSATEAFRARFSGTDFERVVSQRDFGTRENSSQKLEWIHPETGQKQWLRVDILYVDLMGKPKCILSIGDFTKEELLQDSLRTAALAAQNANQVKSQFLSNMSHEIRTPLNAINGMLQIAEKRLADGGDVIGCLEKADRASKQLLSLINDILDISKIESGKMMLEEKWFRMDELLRTVCDTVEVRANEKSQQFEVDIRDCEGLEVLGDSVRLGQILLNLLSNAFKYTQEGGHIALRVRRDSSYAENMGQFTFTVEDNGYGMSEEFQKRMFLPFEQENDAQARRESGTGLGLSIVNNIVSLMGGFLKIDSEKGSGSSFEISLVFQCGDTVPAAQKDLPQTASVDFSGQCVLLAEDNAINREIATEFLEMVHAKVVCAENGKEAFEIFRDSPEETFDFILMDVQMPVWDGQEATRRIRELLRPDAKTVLIIAATANAFLEDEKKCLAAGMDDYISKPMDMDKLYQKILKHMEV